MDVKRIRKAAMVAFFVSISAQIHIDFLTDGFIIAISTIVMAIFVYCYEDLSPAYIICLSGIFSPLVRFLIASASEGMNGHTAFTVLPDMIFFFAYAAVYILIYKYLIRAPKTMRNFTFVVFFADFIGNICEICFRSVLNGVVLLTPTILAYLALIALLRSVIILMVIIAIEAYGNLLINQERDKDYRRLLTQASIIEGEVQIMNKNMMDVEEVMKKAYDLYYKTQDLDYPADITDDILEIAKDAHEIKGDYRNGISVLNEIFLRDLKQEQMWISEIISLEQSNVLAMAKRSDYDIQIIAKVQSDFMIRESFKMMSIIRNLMTNAVEAVGKGPGKITVITSSQDDPTGLVYGALSYRIIVRDNGPGISADKINDIFLEGYSTKFDVETGDIQRGLGLCLVKDYIERVFSGSIVVSSEPGINTEFTIDIPADMIDKRKPEK